MTCQCDRTRQPRRHFIGLLVGAVGLLLPGRARAKKLAVKLEALPALKRVGGWVVAKIKGRELLLIRSDEGAVRALSPFCTHKRFRLIYNPKARAVECSNHGSRFDLAGKVLKGPAGEALPRYQAQLEKDRGRVILELG